MFRDNTAVIISAILMFIAIFNVILRITNKNYFYTTLISYFFGNALFYYVFHASILTRKNATTWLMESIVLLAFAWLLVESRNFRKTAKLYHYWFLFIVSCSSGWLLLGNTHGLIDATSFESGMLMFTVLMPYLHYKNTLEKLILGTLIGFALWIGGSTGLAILLICLLGVIFYSNYKKLKIVTILTGLCGLVLAYKYTDLLNDSNRFKIWSQYITEWHDNANMLIGSGIGTFRNIAPKIETVAGTLVYAHNDFLELYLETGLIGIFVLSLLMIKFFKVCYKTKTLHYAAMMFVFSFNYFPNQILLTKMIFVLSVTIIFKKYNEMRKSNS